MTPRACGSASSWVPEDTSSILAAAMGGHARVCADAQGGCRWGRCRREPLREAKQLGLAAGLQAQWVRGDVRRVVALRGGSCEAVVVMDAFGFFEEEDENERVLAEAAGRILVPGGRLVLKVVNGEPIVASFRHADREERDGVVVTVSRSLIREPSRMIERVSVSGSRGSREY